MTEELLRPVWKKIKEKQRTKALHNKTKEEEAD
jgi:hypothetical protein